MKKKMKRALRLFLVVIFTAIFQMLQAQNSPEIFFFENPKTHNMHICSDGKFFYTVNGGKSNEGTIWKYNLAGKEIASYPIKLDMRSIMYNASDKSLYVSTYEKEIYKITDLEQGVYSKLATDFLQQEQSTPAMDPKGRYIYELSYGTLFVYNLKSGKTENTFYGLNCGEDVTSGAGAVAVDKKHIYTWNAAEQEVYVYSNKGVYIDSFKIKQGDYGFSLSYANGHIFVSTDGNYGTGTWFGYKVPK